MTSEAFAAAFSGRTRVGRLGGREGALAWYRRFHRAGEPASPYPVVKVLRDDSAEGEVVKFLTSVPGVGTGLGAGPGAGATAGAAAGAAAPGLEVESVLIPMVGSSGARTYTLCVSSQIGCAMGCTFCETGQMGLVRSLAAGEIVAQWWNAAHVLGVRPKNIVFMGMGEPLDNLDAVVGSIGVLKDHNGPHVPVSQITVSTVGRVDGIRELAEVARRPGWRRLGLALSLNAPNDADRSAIMPINRRWNLRDVQAALLAWPQRSGAKVCVEYVLIPAVNDSRAHAEQVAEFMRPFGLLTGGRVAGQALMAVLNLIPYNPRRESPWPAPEEARVEEFLGWLIELGVFAKRRRTKGRAMMGACGQLGSASIRRRRFVPLTTP